MRALTALVVLVGCSSSAPEPSRPVVVAVAADAAPLGEPNDVPLDAAPPVDASVALAPPPNVAPERDDMFSPSKSCYSQEVKCTVEMSPLLADNAKAPAAGGNGSVRGTISRDVTSGMIGHSGSHDLADDCTVTAIDDAGKTFTAKVKKGHYSLSLPTGRYHVNFDDCFTCVVTPKPSWLAVRRGAVAKANASCVSPGA